MLLCKLFSALLLSLHEGLVVDGNCKLRSFRCLLATAKYSIECKIQSDLKKSVQSYCDSTFLNLEQYHDNNMFTNKEQENQYKRLKVEMFVLYQQNSLEESDLKMARFFQEKAAIETNFATLDADTLIEICRTVYNSALMITKDHSMGTELSDLIHMIKVTLNYFNLEVPGLEIHHIASSLKYSISLFLVNIMIEDNTETASCQERIFALIKEYSNKPEPYKLGIKFHELHNPGDYKYLEELTMQMLMSVNIPSTIEEIIGFINHQAELDSESALRCLDFIFFSKTDPNIDCKVLELCLTTRCYVVSQSKTLTNEQKIKDLTQMISNVQNIIVKELSKQCTTSIITLLFNQGKQLYKANKQADCVKWFELALNELFSTGCTDKGKIQRAMQFALVEMKDFERVKAVYFEMSTFDQHNALSQLNMFRVYATQNDFDAAKKCLDSLKESNDERAVDALIVAVSECKRSTEWGVYGMMSMFEKLQNMENGSSKTREGSIICCLRYTVQMLLKMTEKEDIQDLVNNLATLHMLMSKGWEFIGTARTLKKLSGKVHEQSLYNEVISVDDIEWFASVCHNIARKLLNKGETTNTNLLIDDCKSYLGYVPKHDLNDAEKQHYRFWEIRTDILYLELYYQNSDWKLLKEKSSLLLVQMQDLFNDFKDGAVLQKSKVSTKELRATFADIILQSFEAAMNLCDLRQLIDIMEFTSKRPDCELDEMVLDAFISSQNTASDAFATTLLKTVIDRNMAQSSVTSDTLSMWIRFLIKHSKSAEEETCLTIITQFQNRVKVASDYSATEIEWLTTVIWNHGVSYIISDNRPRGVIWCKKAHEISKLSASGTLKNQLLRLWSDLSDKINLNCVIDE
ncbi:unnamed protein product [Kluyveromyces dobzhanskii CBS 2104]|uniref:Protein ZIP4 homolog n=1 Tax=Kluyveromyces dobzhanskii CBS 2104 TaxID=1427455 RepID=A0A0A8L2N1_9SACH|nr:unnamed protein product [Kluyveromyces dobzhanskii CBS 2104]